MGNEALVPAGRGDQPADHFNAIRLAMALTVIWSHCFALYFGSEDAEPISVLLAGLCNAGNLGVRVFFVISGFLIAGSYLARGGGGAYFARRAARIYPGFIVATAFCWFLVVPLYASAGWALVTPRLIADWAWHALTLQGAIPGADAFADNPLQAVNGALWSIRFEAWCYVGLAVLGMAGALRRPRMVLALMLAAMAGKAVLDLSGRQPGGGVIEAVLGWPYAWFSLAPCFLAGVLVRLRGTAIPRKGWWLAASVAALVAAAHLGEGSRVAFDLLFPVAIAYATFYAAFSPARMPDVARFGDFSYGAYLYGFPIQQMVRASFSLPFAAYVAACLSLSVLAGVASWHLVEKRFTQRREARPSKERAPTVQAA